MFDNFTMLVGISDLIPKTPITIAAGTIPIFLTRHTIVVECYSFTLIVHVSTGAFVRLSVLSFPDANFNKYQWMFTKLGICIHILEIWFGIANGQISPIFDKLVCPPDNSVKVL